MRRTTLKTKLVRAMVISLTAVAAILIALLVSVSMRFSARNLAAIEQHHQESLNTKAKLLADNHSLALKGLVLDNAFGDIQQLIQRTVTDDRELVYGLFTSGEGKVLAFAGPGASPGIPDPKAYSRLGLTESALAVAQQTTRETELFGEHVIEVAAPVRDNTEMLGTVRYGLSSRRMREALQTAREESQADIIRSLSISLGVAIAAAVIAALMSRKTSERIAQPIIDLAIAAKALAAGRREVHVEIKSNDEVQDLGDAFNQMVADLKVSYDSLEDMNRNLEKKVEARTVELAGRNRDMRLVLDNVEEGFLTIDADGVMALEHSLILDRWFGTYGEKTKFSKYIEGTNPTFAATFDLGWDAIVDGFLPIDLCIDQLPHRIHSRANTWQVRYTAIMNSGRLEGVLVVVQDITASLLRQREEQEQRGIMSAFQRLMRDRTGFLAFYRETSSLIQEVADRKHDEDVPTLKRIIHTVKGNTGIFGIERVAALCHQMEEDIAELGDAPSADSIAELTEAWQVITNNVSHVTEGSELNLEVPREDIQTLATSLKSIPSARHLAGVVENWQREPIQVPLKRLAEQSAALAQRLGKGEVQISVQADLVRCDARRWAPFWSDLVHVVRNAVDHGLETPTDREKLGKGKATLEFKAGWEGNELVVSVADDGRGISFEQVKEKAEMMQLPSRTKEDLVNALFADGMTTRDEVTEHSGRGVGMSAVKSRVEAMGGHVKVESAEGKGTTFKFCFPRRDSLRAPPPPAKES